MPGRQIAYRLERGGCLLPNSTYRIDLIEASLEKQFPRLLNGFCNQGLVNRCRLQDAAVELGAVRERVSAGAAGDLLNQALHEKSDDLTRSHRADGLIDPIE